MQDVDNLSVQDIPRSTSSLSVRTDASGTGVSYSFQISICEVKSLQQNVLFTVCVCVGGGGGGYYRISTLTYIISNHVHFYVSCANIIARSLLPYPPFPLSEP